MLTALTRLGVPFDRPSLEESYAIIYQDRLPALFRAEKDVSMRKSTSLGNNLCSRQFRVGGQGFGALFCMIKGGVRNESRIFYERKTKRGAT